MEYDLILEQLELIFRKVFTDTSIVINSEMTANDIENWDSLTHMLLISEIEDQFKVKFKLKELNKMRNVGDMIEIISSKL
ncbi:MAG: acyl carrier protein [Candidatus Atribacteria bacterium]|nr:acyl carrier protein [Candidatus Atribacteria bacterium]